MHPNTYARWPRLCAGLILVAGLAGAAAHGPRAAAQPSAKDATVGDVRVDPKTGALIVPTGSLVRFDPKVPKGVIIQDIQVNRDDILQARLDDKLPGAILLTG